MKFISNNVEMASNRRAVVICRAELAIAENLAEAVKHEVEIRECHLKIAQATLRGEALAYCERKVRKYRPELGTCVDEQWKVMKDWTGLSIMEIQPEAGHAQSHEQDLAKLRAEIDDLKRVNESLRQENGQLRAMQVTNPTGCEARSPAVPQRQHKLITKGNLNSDICEAREMQRISDERFSGCSLSLDDGGETSRSCRYTINASPSNANAQGQRDILVSHGMTSMQALEYQEFTKLIELANLHSIVTAIQKIPSEIFQERTGGVVDCVKFREDFGIFLQLCMQKKLTSDEELEKDESAYALYMELRNSAGRAAERWEVLSEYERVFL